MFQEKGGVSLYTVMPECVLPFEPNNFHTTLFYLANIMILK